MANNLKSYNTNLLANIKSINTNLIANVKSLNTNSVEVSGGGIVTDGLISWWKLDETSGTDVADSFGSNTATNSGATINQTPPSGMTGKAYLFDRMDDFLHVGPNEVGQSTDIIKAGALTLSLWVNPQMDFHAGAWNHQYHTFIGDSDLIGYAIGNGQLTNIGYDVGAYIPNRIYFVWGPTLSGIRTTTDINTLLPQNNWTYLTATRGADGLRSSCHIYINGVETETQVCFGNSTPSDNGRAVVIGGAFLDGTYTPCGCILDEVLVYDKQLSQTEITQNYEARY